jgi:methylenetetrahydrofolate reductase (NADPH)
MNEPTNLQQRLESGKSVLLAEISPPAASVRGSAASESVRQMAKRFAGKVHALGISDNRERVGMAALAAASLVAGQGVEPVLHVTTRDRNRIALVSEVLGAQALGIRNIFCTSGTHQTLGHFRAAKNVYDIDVIQLLQTCGNLASDAALVGEEAIAGAEDFCLGAVASPNADPLELQMIRLGKKVAAGAGFLVSQPVYDLERFNAWWAEVSHRGLHEKVAILAGIEPLGEAALEHAQTKRRPLARIPDAVLQQVASKTDAAARRRAAIDVAVQTVKQLSATKGLRGFSISVDGDQDAALEIIEKSGLGTN